MLSLLVVLAALNLALVGALTFFVFKQSNQTKSITSKITDKEFAAVDPNAVFLRSTHR